MTTGSKPRSKGRRAVVLKGVAFVVLAGVALWLVGLCWTDIYFSFYPEARFCGRWELVKPDGTRAPLFGLPLVLEFREEGVVAFGIAGAHSGINGGLIRADKDVSTHLLGLPSDLRYRVTRNRIAFSNKGSTISAKYRFRTDELLVLEFEEDRSLGSENAVVLQRLPEP